MLNAMPSSRGFAFTEVLVATFILGVSTLAIVGLSVLGTRSSIESKRQTVALGFVNQRIEKVRGLPYGQVGYVEPAVGEPAGLLTHEEKVTENQQSYNITTTIKFVDDPANGSVSGSLDEDTADYKEVKVIATWNAASAQARQVSETTYIANGNLTCVPGTPQACPVPPPLEEGIECTPGEEGVCPGDATCPDSGSCPVEPSSNPQPQCEDCTNGVCPSVEAGSGSEGGGGGEVGYTPTPSPFFTYVECPATGVCPGYGPDTSPSPAPDCPPGALFCPQCYADSDCDAGNKCSSGKCVDICTGITCGAGEACDPNSGQCASSCTSYSQCGAGQDCVSGVCTDTTNCSVTGCADGQTCDTASGQCGTACGAYCSCGEGEECSNGACLPTPTPTPSDLPPCTLGGCPGDLVCDPSTGQCGGECTTSTDCPEGEICPASGACVPPCGNSGITCQGDLVCNLESGSCEEPCTAGSCGSGLVCNVDTGMCGEPCTTNAECSNGEVCDADSGSCQPPCTEEGVECQNGSVCNSTSGTCDPPQPCTDDAQCIGSSFPSCNTETFTCTPDDCIPPGASLTCPGAVDSGCGSSAACQLGGRYVTTFAPASEENTDPNCNLNAVAICRPTTVWVECDCPPPPPPVCGDGVCSYGYEGICPFIGGDYCYGDGNDNLVNCPEDCSVCGDGYCTGPETSSTCPEDCPVDPPPPPPPPPSCDPNTDPYQCAYCGDGFCNATSDYPDGETYEVCPVDCPPPTPTPTPSDAPPCGGTQIGTCPAPQECLPRSCPEGTCYDCDIKCEDGGEWCQDPQTQVCVDAGLQGKHCVFKCGYSGGEYCANDSEYCKDFGSFQSCNSRNCLYGGYQCDNGGTCFQNSNGQGSCSNTCTSDAECQANGYNYCGSQGCYLCNTSDDCGPDSYCAFGGTLSSECNACTNGDECPRGCVFDFQCPYWAPSCGWDFQCH